MPQMQLVEKLLIERKDLRFAAIDAACFASKNLYNAALYVVRNEYLLFDRYVLYEASDKQMQYYVSIKHYLLNWHNKYIMG
jgi:putative transposase